MIDGIFVFILNTIFDIRDLIETGKEQPINGNIITLQCVCTDDLPIDVRNSYCESLEIIYAMIIRGMLNIQDRSRFNSTPTSILTSLPMLTPHDKVKFSEKLNGFVSVKDSILSGQRYGGQKALTAFTENLDAKLNELVSAKAEISYESDIILKDATSAAPTFVEVTINVSQFGGRVVEKKFTIGVQVRPKVVSTQEMMQFILKRNNAVADTDGATRTVWQRMKNKFMFNHKRVKNTVKSGEIAGEKTLNEMMESVKGIKKPFVCLLMSNLCRDGLRDLNVDLVKNTKLTQKLYETLPIMSISIYDANTDTITYSLTKDSYFMTRTAAEFNSEVSQYEKQLAELVRVNRLG